MALGLRWPSARFDVQSRRSVATGQRRSRGVGQYPGLREPEVDISHRLAEIRVQMQDVYSEESQPPAAD